MLTNRPNNNAKNIDIAAIVIKVKLVLYLPIMILDVGWNSAQFLSKQYKLFLASR